MSTLDKSNYGDVSLRFSPAAVNDIKGTWAYLIEKGFEKAADFIRAIIKKCELLARNPYIGRERDDLITGLRQFSFKNYNIFYFITENGIEIYRVLHSSRDTIQVFDDTVDAAG